MGSTMTDYLAMRHAVIRESATEKKIRSMDVSDIVELIHRLEDEIDELESMLAAAESQPVVPDAHQLWAAAQLGHGEGITDGIARIEALLAAGVDV